MDPSGQKTAPEVLVTPRGAGRLGGGRGSKSDLMIADLVPHVKPQTDLAGLIAQAERLAARYQQLADKHAAIYAALRSVQAQRSQRLAATRPRLPDKTTWATWIDRSLPGGDR